MGNHLLKRSTWMSYDVLITFQAYYRCIVMFCFVTVIYCVLIRHIFVNGDDVQDGLVPVS